MRGLILTHHKLVQMNVLYTLVVVTRGRAVSVMVIVDTVVFIPVSKITVVVE